MYDIYSNACNDTCRFKLGKSGKRKLLVIGLNPSTASKECSDTTVAKVEKVSIQKGFDGFIMLNLYPVRSTDFQLLKPQPDVEAFNENIRQIINIVLLEANPTVWLAWGENINHFDFFLNAFFEITKALKNHRVKWLHFGSLTKSGHPRHPSRLSYSWNFSSFNIQKYSQQLRNNLQ
jgi:hypothetical protein